MTDESLFTDALAISDSVARAAFLDGACRGDAELRRRIEGLLAANSGTNPLDRSPADLARTGDAPWATRTHDSDRTATVERVGEVGQVIAGKYKLIESIGEGGMGSVWMAQQTEPVKRAVALKLIKAGMDSKAVLARFDAERQALAMMDHPNIARVLDAGATAEGRPYFVMELVKGIPITQFCDARKLTPNARLELFVQVCQAIQHAHQKGVIHRDIKPSNVLVALYDDRPVPKVIDFGVAKATGATLTDKTLMTGFGAVVGTPEYMSPEQASLNQLDVDTRSDIYALGVLLYELLTGTTPVDRKTLGQAALLEILRIVREVEAPRPSAKLSTSAALPTISANRGVEPKKLTGLMRNELDWIVMKALEKDRTRRYETANGFAADVQRYLAGESVEACPPTLGYRLRKAYRKNRGAVRVASAFFCLMLGAVAMGAYLAVQATRAEAAAEVKRIEAETNAKVAAENAERAERTSELYMKEIDVNLKARLQANIAAMSLQTDLDLIELRTDARVGLLRLARPTQLDDGPKKWKSFGSDGQEIEVFAQVNHIEHPEFKSLREFVTAAVVAIGQNYAPLLPPMPHDGHPVLTNILSPDAKLSVTIGADGTTRLWKSRSAEAIALLREGTERVVQVGFSPDGKTIYTSDIDSIVRFWNSTDGTFRAKTTLSPNRFVYPKGLAFEQLPYVASTANRIAITNTRLLIQANPIAVPENFAKGDDIYGDGPTRPAELWNSATGRMITRFDSPRLKAENFQFVNAGKWLLTTQEKTQVVLFSGDDGTEIGRLVLPKGEEISGVEVSPNGRRIVTRSGAEQTYHPRIWEGNPWRIVPDPVLDPLTRNHGIYFLTDDLLTIHTGETLLYRIGDASSKLSLGDTTVETKCNDLLLSLNDERIFDSNSFKRLAPVRGRKYPSSFARLAFDQRFVSRERGARVIDTVTEKQIELAEWESLDSASYSPAWGTVTIAKGTEIRIFPSPERLDIPPYQLQLWAQVLVCGELGMEGQFVKWDESTWENKRRELAAMPPPYPDFPFPGRVASDTLYWLKCEYKIAPAQAKHQLANELLRKARIAADKNEVACWSVELEKLNKKIESDPKK